MADNGLQARLSKHLKFQRRKYYYSVLSQLRATWIASRRRNSEIYAYPHLIHDKKANTKESSTAKKQHDMEMSHATWLTL